MYFSQILLKWVKKLLYEIRLWKLVLLSLSYDRGCTLCRVLLIFYTFTDLTFDGDISLAMRPECIGNNAESSSYFANYDVFLHLSGCRKPLLYNVLNDMTTALRCRQIQAETDVALITLLEYEIYQSRPVQTGGI